MLAGKKILIVEDEAIIAEHLRMILEQYEATHIEWADTKEAAIKAINDGKPDISLLDINLSGKTEGIDIAQYINTTHKHPFIFITAYSESTLLTLALEKHPAAYITKPFKQADVIAAIQLALVYKPTATKEHLVFKNGDVVVKLNSNQITHIEASGNYIIIHQQQQKYTLRHTLAWALEHLPEADYLKVHRAFIVNINHIKEFNYHELKIGATTIPLSRLFKVALTEKIQLAKKK
jgi:DNA-binding LytR/AlgR family response regulator